MITWYNNIKFFVIILLGDIVNTNSAYLAKELALLGIDVYHQSCVGDNEQRLMDTFSEGLKRSDIIITTGGLGPTSDDITKEVACKMFEQEMNFLEKYAPIAASRNFTLVRLKGTVDERVQQIKETLTKKIYDTTG